MKIVRSIKPEFLDDRGGITKILDEEGVVIKSILLITSKPGAVRANHFHKKDSHYCYLASGSMEYFERPVGSTEPPTKEIIHAGDMVYTPPMHEHAMRFLEDSVFYAYATEHRSSMDYESDTVRVKVI